MQCQKESLENDTRQYITFNTHYVNNRKTFHEMPNSITTYDYTVKVRK